MTNHSVQYFEPDLDFLTWLKITLFQSRIWYAPAGISFFLGVTSSKPRLGHVGWQPFLRRASRPTGGDDL